jgi:hypothetical protein
MERWTSWFAYLDPKFRLPFFSTMAAAILPQAGLSHLLASSKTLVRTLN